MSSSVLYMSMSLDGFIAGPGDSAEQGLGAGGERLHEWLGAWDGSRPSGFQPAGESAQIFAELMATGAVVVGRRTFDYAGHWEATITASRSSFRPAVSHRSRLPSWSTTSPTGSRAP